MARLTLQVKNVASLVFATAASVSFSFASRRFDSPTKPWVPFAVYGAVLLACQLALIFVESKEEEELSLVRKHRMAELKLRTAEAEAVSVRIQAHTQAGDIEGAQRWTAYRRRNHGR